MTTSPAPVETPPVMTTATDRALADWPDRLIVNDELVR